MQVIEKALKKLKLDAMIIQQGRLSDNKASVNKDDLLSMVRYGAEMVFSGGGGTITDEDIDAIIAKVTITVLSLQGITRCYRVSPVTYMDTWYHLQRCCPLLLCITLCITPRYEPYEHAVPSMNHCNDVALSIIMCDGKLLY